ncbi:MAG: helicase-related protein [Chloroflexota bacterium]
MTDHRELFPPVFATNRPPDGETVAEAVNRLLSGSRENLAAPPDLALATAYLNPAGFNLIADEVEQAPRVRLLLGAEPETPPVRRTPRPSPFEEHLAGLVDERDLTGFTIEADRSARRLVEWLRRTTLGDEPTVEVRRLTEAFLHGKAFIVVHPSYPAVLAGSSNLTFAGLTRNRELNLGYPQGQYTQLVIDWFDALWDLAEPFDLAAVYEARWKAHEPWTVFLRMLYELYGFDEEEDDFAVSLGLNLTGFQRDGVARSLRILDELGGVLVCDEVGLGKTFIAGEIIHRAAVRGRQQVLIVVPAALKDSTWVPFLRQFGLYSNRVQVVTYDDLRLGTKLEVQNLEQYALVVIDEAHNLRNTATQRAEAVKDLLGGEYAKRVVLLTATPVNNSLLDLQSLVSYFVKNDSQFASIGIPSIGGYIKRASDMDPDALAPEHLFDLMDQVAVRRTRRFIKDNYRGEHLIGPGGQPIEIEFPTPLVYRADYDLSPQGQELLDAVIYALEVSETGPLARKLTGNTRDPDRLSMARYTTSLYRLDDNIEGRQMSNSGLLRSALLKRLESSAHALANTLGRLIASHETFLTGLTGGVVLTGEALDEFSASDDEIEDFLDAVDTEALTGIDSAAAYDVEDLTEQVELDLVLLHRLRQMAQDAAAADDPKAAKLVRLLDENGKAAARPSRDGVSEGDRRKVIVFSTYTDTIRNAREAVVHAIETAPEGSVLASYRGRVSNAVFGSKTGIDQESRAHTLARFAPATAGRRGEDGTPLDDDRYDLLFTTDVLSEGVNLQQAGHIINYDLPWNPQRMVQRHGRVDRIGSHHKFVQFGCFFPARNLDRLLGLEATLQRKLAYANAAIGVGEVLPGQITDPTVQVALADIENQQELIKSLHDQKPVLLDDSGGSAALSGEEYRRRLERALGHDNLRRDVLALAYGSGSGFVSERVRQPGWVFCARIGIHPKPWFRFVGADDSWQPAVNADGLALILDDTLSALVAADPGGADCEQDLAEGAANGVFDAWVIAQEHIHDAWSRLTDIANLQPEIPLALREAAELVVTAGDGLGLEEQQNLLRRLNARWDRRIVGEVRRIVRSGQPARTRVSELAEYVKEEGLPLPEPPEPLLPVDRDDIRLVCWMAVRPHEPTQTIGEWLGELPVGDRL